MNKNAIAIIGMSCRFPGAGSVEQFHDNLAGGVESIRPISDNELRATGVAQSLIDHPDYVKMTPSLDGYDQFDAGFFGLTKRDAMTIDPQHRLFLECAWEALETAGYAADPALVRRPIGVFGGSGSLMGTYLLSDLHVNAALIDRIASRGHVGNDKDHLCTRVAYMLNLGGPALTVQTACSTSLVAVHLACQSLLTGECDMALAGGVTVRVPHESGYLYEKGLVYSPDGHCRAFDADGNGTIFGSGVGVVVLKPLEKAQADGDIIDAVILSSTINNDGAQKMSYWATNHQGQSEAIERTLGKVGVSVETIGYVEAHGTATHLGDMIEMFALRKAFNSKEKQYCAVGSVKSNIGHTDSAAGVAGLIKTVLSLKNKTLYPSLHFSTPNPRIDFANSPFYVNTETQTWESDTPRRACVNSLGIGGTNAFALLQEPPTQPSQSANTEPAQHLLTISAKSENALRDLALRYHDFLTDDSSLQAVCYAAHSGRAHFEQRLSIVGDTPKTVRDRLAAFVNGKPNPLVNAGKALDHAPAIAFLFTGQGSQYIGMSRDLYETVPAFRAIIDECDTHLPFSLTALLYATRNTQHDINDTTYTQPALFALQYALAKLWLSWGVKPEIVIGHSVGEIAAACVAGAFSLADGLKLIEARGRLMGALPRTGTMVSCLASEAQVREMIAPYGERVSIAVINGASSTVIAGEREAVLAVKAELDSAEIKARELTVSHAFHSALMEPMLDEFRAVAETITYHEPHITLVSNVAGEIDEVISADYWVRHIRETVRFADGLNALREEEIEVFLEIGPQPTLLGMARHTFAQGEREPKMVASLRKTQDDLTAMLTALGTLYVQGVRPSATPFMGAEKPQKVRIPTYPFQRKRYWINDMQPALTLPLESADPKENSPLPQENNPSPPQHDTASPPSAPPVAAQTTQPMNDSPQPTTVELNGLLQQLMQQTTSEITIQIEELRGLSIRIAPANRGTAQPAAVPAAPTPAAPAPSATPAKRQLTPLTPPSVQQSPPPAPVAAPPVRVTPPVAPVAAPVSVSKLDDIKASLTQIVIDVLYLDEDDEVKETTKFTDLGMDSVTGVEFVNAINKQYDLSLRAYLIYDYTTIAALAEYIDEQLGGSKSETAKPAAPQSEEAPSDLRSLLTNIANGSLSLEEGNAQLGQLNGVGTADKAHIRTIVHDQMRLIIPDLNETTGTFDELGFDSVEQAEVIVGTLESLEADIPRVELAKAKSPDEMVELLALKLN